LSATSVLSIWTTTLRPRGRRISNIEFLAIKRFEGKLRDTGDPNPTCNEGNRTSVGDLASVTAGTGKDLYLATAKISWRGNDDTADNAVTIELKINGNVVETYQGRKGVVGTPSTTMSMQGDNYEFKSVGHKVDATQVIKLEVTGATNALIEGEIQCWDETDGETPQITT
jgi:hypothetical protein